MQKRHWQRILTTWSRYVMASLILVWRITDMKLLTNLFSSDYGLMSLAVIALVIFMSVWYYRFFKRHMEEDAKNAGQ